MKNSSKYRAAGAFLSLVMLLSGMQAFPVFAAGTAEVGTYQELRSAIQNKSIDYITLTDDIQLGKDDTYVNADRSSLTIDGQNRFTLTDAETSDLADTFRVEKRGNLNEITVKDVTIEGRNKYGFISVPESSVYQDMQLTYDNVTYSGPKLVKARYSDVELIDCNISLVPGYGNTGGEVAEASNIVVSGDTTIIKDQPACADEIFLVYKSKGGITISENANVNVLNNQDLGRCAPSGSTLTPYSGFAYYCGNGGYMNFERNSAFNYTGNNHFQELGILDSVSIGEEAIVDITTRGNYYSDNSIFKVQDKMTVGESSILNIRSYENQTLPPSIQLRGTGVLEFDDVGEAFIYNSSTKDCNTGLAMGPYGCDVRIIAHSADSIEYWALNKKSIEDLGAPKYNWHNENGWGGFYMATRISGACVLEAFADGYNGVTPVNKTTAAVKNINVVSINGGRGASQPVTPETVTVTFETQGGTPVPAQQFPEIGTKVLEPAAPAKEGFVFGGWYPTADCTGDAWNFTLYNVEADITLYAKWTEAVKPMVAWRLVYFKDTIDIENRLGSGQVRKEAVELGSAFELTIEELNYYKNEIADAQYYYDGVVYDRTSHAPAANNIVTIDEENKLITVIYLPMERPEVTFIVDHLRVMSSGGRPTYIMVEETQETRRVGDMAKPEDFGIANIGGSNDSVLYAEIYGVGRVLAGEEFEITEGINVNLIYGPRLRIAMPLDENFPEEGFITEDFEEVEVDEFEDQAALDDFNATLETGALDAE
jgi:uncharacterized repeat protein (TIGR02543 family)